MAKIEVGVARMFDETSHGVAVTFIDDDGDESMIIIPNHVAILVALEIKRAAEKAQELNHGSAEKRH